MPRSSFVALLALALGACATVPLTAPIPAPPQRLHADDRVIPEHYVSAATPTDELDSLAVWPREDGSAWLIATAKSTHELVVYDAATGLRLRGVGRKGNGAGEFLRPNGIAVFGNRVFVVERDNHRVQVLSLPDFKPLGTFGDTDLRSPYGIWLQETGPDDIEAYVTDSFMLGAKFDVVPPLAELDRRVHRYRVSFDDDTVQASPEGTFGSTDPALALRIVESIAGDPSRGTLLVADEDTHPESTLREYAFDGTPTGRRVPSGSFDAQAEGVALWSCGVDSGYWVAVDQVYPLTRFVVFDRDTLAARGVFTGETTAHTDGIALEATSSDAFPFGALFAVHDDKAVAAFDLGEVARTLHLDPACSD